MRMLKYSLILLLAHCFGLISPAQARNSAKQSPSYIQMKDDALRAVFSDTVMVGEYRTYRDITKTFNYTEFHTIDGTTDYKEGRKHEDGLWTIIGGDKICYKYPKSNYYTRTYCFFVYESEACYYKYTPANMTLRGPRSWNSWSSRAVREGSGGSCAAPVG